MNKTIKLAIAIASASAAAQVFAVCPAGTNDVSADYTVVGAGFSDVCEIQGQDVGNPVVTDLASLSADLTLTADTLWVLDGKVNFCENTQRAIIDANGDNATFAVSSPSTSNATLSIEAGATIIGDSDVAKSNNDFGLDYLVINRGCDIDAQGAADSPIRMTSFEDLSGANVARGQWGGLYVNGESPSTNLCLEDGEIAGVGEVCLTNGEADTGTHGGDNPADSSGTIRYLTVSYAGFQFSLTSELNGIALQNVGSGTAVEFIQVHENADDGIELFGGDVSVSNVVLTNNGDDGFDLTDGWMGNAQFVLVYNQEDAINGNNRAFENNGGGVAPFSAGNISNVTVISESLTVGDVEIMRSRENNDGRYINVAVTRPAGLAGECLDEDATSTWSSAYADCDTVGSAPGALAYSSTFNGYINGANERALAATNPAAIDAALAPASFVGAVQNCSNDWTEGWVIPDTLPVTDCVNAVQVPAMGWPGLIFLFAGLAGLAVRVRQIK